MSEFEDDKFGKAVPTSRLSRLAGLGGMAAGVAGRMALKGVQQMASGKRPKVEDLLLTPANALRVTHQLANMRGAAMKIGQMISMDSGDFLPQEFADILAKLRSEAHHMPRAQLNQVLAREWGTDWQLKFATFDYRPIAAASIGQVHRAKLMNGEELAIKVQYPGVNESIDSDVKNVASLLKMTGLVPAELKIDLIIEEGRLQLHQEADYGLEANYLQQFGKLLADDEAFQVPSYYPDISTQKILSMSHIAGSPIEDMVHAQQEVRNHIANQLMTLVMRELFEFKLMQTDPNFANYRYNKDTKRIVLLDFGATREISDILVQSYRDMLKALIQGDKTAVFEQCKKMGFIPAQIPKHHSQKILELIEMAIEPLSRDEPFDFGQNQLALDLRDRAMALAANRELWHIPSAQTIFVQRKVGGIYLLATRLKAQVNVRGLLERYLPL